MGTANRAQELDSTIARYSIGWDLGRISRLTRAVLQLALFECQYVEDVPAGVAVNEAVSLAKKYDGDDAGAFVNGILRAFLRAAQAQKDTANAEPSEAVTFAESAAPETEEVAP